ncbi:hypothetical protein NQZ68_003648 [Dissostichus eleginoides]|nr:hypothetical protein NQZ68_003648 [Dissostichus eleginoides]
MAVCLCCLKLQSDWSGLCSEPVSTVLPQCRLAAELPTAVELCPPRHAGLSAEEAKPSTPAPGVCQQNPGAPASPWTEIRGNRAEQTVFNVPHWPQVTLRVCKHLQCLALAVPAACKA